MPDEMGKPRPSLLDRLIQAYRSMLGQPDRPVVPPPPDPAEYIPDTSPPTPDERARAEAAAREAMRRLREDG
jgi:hypothetical protein